MTSIDILLQRLQSLNTSVDINVLSNIQEKYVISGGCIVYTLCDWVSKKSVNDIDIFILNCHNREDCIREFNEIKNIITIDGFNEPYYTFRGMLLEENISVIDVLNNRSNDDVNLQIIFTDFKDADEVINDFDIDYVQCAIHNNKLYITEDCKKAHSDGKIYRTIPLDKIKPKRLWKPLIKDFKLPYFGFASKVGSFDKIKWVNEINDKLNPKDRAYYEREKRLLYNGVDIESLNVISLNKDLIINESTSHYSSRGRGKYVNFVLKDNQDQEFQCRTISTVIDIKNISSIYKDSEDNNSYVIEIEEHPFFMKKITLNTSRENTQVDKNLRGKIAVLVVCRYGKIYGWSKHGKEKYRFTISGIWCNKDVSTYHGIKIDVDNTYYKISKKVNLQCDLNNIYKDKVIENEEIECCDCPVKNICYISDSDE